jgi:hypothetical protein
LPKRLDRTILRTEVVQIFNAAIKSPVTRDVYERRLLNFLGHINMTPEEFVSMAKNDPLATPKPHVQKNIRAVIHSRDLVL